MKTRIVAVAVLMVLVLVPAHAVPSNDMLQAYTWYADYIAALDPAMPSRPTFAQVERGCITGTMATRQLEAYCWRAWANNGRRYHDWLAWQASVHMVAAWADFTGEVYKSRSGRFVIAELVGLGFDMEFERARMLLSEIEFDMYLRSPW